MPSRSMDSKRCPMCTKLGSPAGQGSASGNPSNVPVLSEKREWRVGKNKPLTASQQEAVRLVEEQDQEYEEAVRVDTEAQRRASVVSGGSDSPQVAEPDANEMRRVRLQRFGLSD